MKYDFLAVLCGLLFTLGYIGVAYALTTDLNIFTELCSAVTRLSEWQGV